MFFSPPKVLESVEARIVRESHSVVRLKLSLKVWRELGIPDKGVFKAVIRGKTFTGRYDVTAGFRLRIPTSKRYLLQPELLVGEKSIHIDLWIEDGIPCISYRPGEKADNPLPHIHPNYRAGDGYCPRCMVSWERPIGDKCLYCGTKLRRRSRKINNGEKKYINPEIEDLE